jgi:hypothetical protein
MRKDYVNLMGNLLEFHMPKLFLCLFIQILMLWMKESFVRFHLFLRISWKFGLKNKEIADIKEQTKASKAEKHPKRENAKGRSKETKALKVEKRKRR